MGFTSVKCIAGKLPAILDSFFTGVANITSTPIGMKGGGGREPQSGRQKLCQHQNQISLAVPFSHKAAKSMG